MKTPQESAYWEWDDTNEEPDAGSGINSGTVSDDYGESHPSKASRSFNR